jgi:hypothetical protein
MEMEFYELLTAFVLLSVIAILLFLEKRKILKHINEKFVFSVTFRKHVIGKLYSETNKTEIVTRYFFAKDEIEAGKKAQNSVMCKLYIETIEIECINVRDLKILTD